MPILPPYNSGMLDRFHTCIIFSLCALFALRVHAQNFVRRAIEPYPDDTTFQYADLVRLIESQDIRSVEDLLARLPEDYRSQRSLVYNSQSAQRRSVNFDNPRIIVFGRGARLILGLNTSPQGREGRTVEVIEVDAHGDFRPHEIEFPERAASSRAQIHASPTTCTQCHQEPFRPNWDSYRLWPGIYGSNHDPESIAQAPANGETAHLRRLRPQFSNPASRLHFFPAGPEPQQNGDQLWGNENRNNHALTQQLSRHNMRRLVNDLREHPQYNRFRYALLATSMGCFHNRPTQEYCPYGTCSEQDRLALTGTARPAPDLTPESFLPRSLQQAGPHFEETNQAVRTAIYAYARRQSQTVRSHVGTREDGGQMTEEAAGVALYRYFTQRMGIDLETYSMAFSPGSMSFFAPSGGLNPQLGSALWESLLEQPDPQLAFVMDGLTSHRRDDDDARIHYPPEFNYNGALGIRPTPSPPQSWGFYVGDLTQFNNFCRDLRRRSLAAFAAPLVPSPASNRVPCDNQQSALPLQQQQLPAVPQVIPPH